VAENLFLRKQIALFQERKTRPRRTTTSFRLAMVALAKFFDWRNALAIVKPETFVGWQLGTFRRSSSKKFQERGFAAAPLWASRPA
jgi:putative transposase